MIVMRDISFVVSIFLVITTVVGQFPQTPCPDVFNYQFVQNEWSGLVQTPSPEIGVKRVLNVNLTMRERLPSNVSKIKKKNLSKTGFDKFDLSRVMLAKSNWWIAKQLR
jgi:hypothetical protein